MTRLDLDYHQLYKAEGIGDYGAIWIKIEIAASALSREQLGCKALRFAAYDAEKILKNAIMQEAMAAIPEQQARAANQRRDLLACFREANYVEAIPNGYCSDGCCKHLPWFIVTTKLGRIKIGWRKSVINIDWTDTKGTKTSKELFANESVTKDERVIHAWGYEKAKTYVDAILTGSPLT